jgi:AcrR family transcriptional regulator
VARAAADPGTAAPTPRAGRRSQLTQQGQDRKEDILRQASALFVERGYADTRMVDIAAAAGVAKGLCYWYFATKEDLLGELVADLQQRLRAAQRRATSGLDSPLERLYAATVVSVLFVAEHKRLYQLFFAVSAGGVASRAVRAARAHDDDAAALLRVGQADGSVRTDEEALTMAFGNAGVVNTVAFGVADGVLGDDLDAVAHGAARYVVRAVAAEPALGEEVLARAAGAPRPVL